MEEDDQVTPSAVQAEDQATNQEVAAADTGEAESISQGGQAIPDDSSDNAPQQSDSGQQGNADEGGMFDPSQQAPEQSNTPDWVHAAKSAARRMFNIDDGHGRADQAIPDDQAVYGNERLQKQGAARATQEPETSTARAPGAAFEQQAGAIKDFGQKMFGAETPEMGAQRNQNAAGMIGYVLGHGGEDPRAAQQREAQIQQEHTGTGLDPAQAPNKDDIRLESMRRATEQGKGGEAYQGHKDHYISFRSKAAAALDSGSPDALSTSTKLFDEGHTYVPNGDHVNFVPSATGVTALVEPPGGHAKSYPLTTDQYRSLLHDRAGEFDHLVENGLGSNLRALQDTAGKPAQQPPGQAQQTQGPAAPPQGMTVDPRTGQTTGSAPAGPETVNPATGQTSGGRPMVAQNPPPGGGAIRDAKTGEVLKMTKGVGKINGGEGDRNLSPVSGRGAKYGTLMSPQQRSQLGFGDVQPSDKYGRSAEEQARQGVRPFTNDMARPRGSASGPLESLTPEQQQFIKSGGQQGTDQQGRTQADRATFAKTPEGRAEAATQWASQNRPGQRARLTEKYRAGDEAAKTKADAVRAREESNRIREQNQSGTLQEKTRHNQATEAIGNRNAKRHEDFIQAYRDKNSGQIEQRNLDRLDRQYGRGTGLVVRSIDAQVRDKGYDSLSQEQKDYLSDLRESNPARPPNVTSQGAQPQQTQQPQYQYRINPNTGQRERRLIQQ